MIEKSILDGLEIPKALLVLFPYKLAKKYQVVPVRIEGGIRHLMVLASGNPEKVDLFLIKKNMINFDFQINVAIVEDMDVYIESVYKDII